MGNRPKTRAQHLCITDYKAFLRKQHTLLNELISKQEEIFKKSATGAQVVMSIGDGVPSHCTFIGRAILNNAMPSTIQTVIVVDRWFSSKGSFFQNTRRTKNPNFNIIPVRADACNLPFPKKLFDFIVASLMLDDCLSHERILTSMLSHLSSSGMVLISGHGLDLMAKKRVPKHIRKTLLGGTHVNQISPKQIDKLLLNKKCRILEKWNNEHGWIRLAERKSKR